VDDLAAVGEAVPSEPTQAFDFVASLSEDYESAKIAYKNRLRGAGSTCATAPKSLKGVIKYVKLFVKSN
jgi:hypothetical protein